MKKFLAQAFQQKYYIPSKVKEKSAVYLKNVQKIGKHLPTVKLMKKANIKRRQNLHLSSVQKYVISSFYNFIWKRISYSVTDLITPSILKSNQLNKITDYRNHVVFCEGTELLLKTSEESYSKCQSTSKHFSEQARGNISGFNTENKSCNNSLTSKENLKVNPECQLSSQTDKRYSNERNKENESLVLNPDKRTLVSHSGDFKKHVEEEDGRLECIQEKIVKNTIDHKRTDFSGPAPCLKTNESNSIDTQKSSYNPFDTNSIPLKGKGVLVKERPPGVLLDKTSTIKEKNFRNVNRYINKKNSINLPNSNQKSDHNLPLKTYPKFNSKISNNQTSSKNGQREDKEVEDDIIFEDSISMKARQSVKMNSNKNSDFYVSLSHNDCSIDDEAPLIDQQECLKKDNKTNSLKADDFQENNYLFIKEDGNYEAMAQEKSNISNQQKAGMSVVHESTNKSIIKTNQDSEEDSNFSNILQQKSNLQSEVVKTNKTVQAKHSKSYKNKRRKANPKQKISVRTNTKKNLQLNIIKDKIRVSKNKEDYNSAKESKLKNTKSPLTETPKSKPKSINNCVNDDENPTFCKELVNQNHPDLTDDTIKPPEIGKTNLVVFDTSQDEGQILVQEQSFGEEIKSNLIDINTVITEENSPKLTKKSHKITNNSTKNIGYNHSKINLKTNDNKSSKPATIKPWKKHKDNTSPDPKKKIKNKNTNDGSNRHLDSADAPKASTAYQEKKTGNANGNYPNSKNAKDISVTKNVDSADKQIKEKLEKNANKTKNSEYQSSLNRTLSNKTLNQTLKDRAGDIVSNTKLPQSTQANVLVGTKAITEKKLQKQSQSQGVRSSVASSKEKNTNLETNVSAAFHNTKTKLESSSDTRLSYKNNTKDNNASFQNSVSIISKTALKSNNKTSLESNDVSLSKTVADISQELNKISGKEEFKLKMNQLLHNFTVTGQKQKANNIQRRIKSQESVNKKHENENKSNKTISQESVAIDKSLQNEQLNVKFSQERSNKKSNLTKDRINTQITTKANVSENVKENNMIRKPENKQAVSVRPALSAPKVPTKSPENVTRSGEKNVQHQVVPKVRNTTNIMSSPKVKTVISNKYEQTSVGNTEQREVKQQVPLNSSLKNKDEQVRTVNSSFTKNEMLGKIVKRRPSE